MSCNNAINFKHYGHTLISTLLSISLSLIVLAGTLHYILLILHTSKKIQQIFDYQQNLLVANHFLGTDLRTANTSTVNSCQADVDYCVVSASIQDLITQGDIKTNSSILSMANNSETIVYYLRKSIIPDLNHLHS